MDRAWYRTLAVALLFVAGVPATGRAHQPVMDMAPRWQEGWGFQVRNEYRFSDELLRGDSDVPNPRGRERRLPSSAVSKPIGEGGGAFHVREEDGVDVVYRRCSLRFQPQELADRPEFLINLS